MQVGTDSHAGMLLEAVSGCGVSTAMVVRGRVASRLTSEVCKRDVWSLGWSDDVLGSMQALRVRTCAWNLIFAPPHIRVIV